MKYKILFILVILAFCFETKAQNTFYDAVFLGDESKQNISNDDSLGIVYLKNNDTQYEILGHYANSNKKKDIIKKFENNPFVRIDTTGVGIFHSSDIVNIVKNGLSNISGLDVTTIVDGLAQFMISRAKDEISVAFIQRFKTQLENHPELQVLFPETSDFLENILAHEYTTILPALQKAFEEDLSNMFYNVEDIFNLPEYKDVLTENPEVEVIIRSMYIISELESGMHPADVLNNLTEIPVFDNNKLNIELKNLKAILDLGNLFSQSIRFKKSKIELYKDDDGYTYEQDDSTLYKFKGSEKNILSEYNNPAWVSEQHLDLLLQDSTTFKIFLGLLYQQSLNDSIRFIIKKTKHGINKNDTIHFHKMLEENIDNLTFIRSQFYKFQRITENINLQITKINKLKKEGKKPTKEDRYNFVNVSLDMIEYGTETIKYFAKDNKQFKNINTNKYISLLKDVNKFYKASYSKDYATMVLYGVNVIENINEIYAREKKIKKLDGKTNRLQNFEELSVYKRRYKRKINRQTKLPKTLSTIIRYGTFMSEIAEADSSIQVKEIIETFALPAGSSSLKKYQSHNFAINSYLGYSFRNQKLDFNENNIWKVYAPVGVAYTPLSLKKGGSVSLFVSLIDIGAIVDYRLKAENDTSYVIIGTDTTTTITKNVEYSNKIQLGNIFSPGASVVYGFGGNIPLALSFGFQYGPGLTEINNEGNVISNPQWMYNISLTIDIPIINIHPGRRKRF